MCKAAFAPMAIVVMLCRLLTLPAPIAAQPAQQQKPIAQQITQPAEQKPVDPPPQTTVGMPGRIDGLVLAGTQLEAVPWTDRKQPINVRIVNSYRHGTAFRYDIEYYGLEPGHYDLSKYLRRVDGSATDTLPAIPVDVSSVLPPGQVEPWGLKASRLPWVGGYRLIITTLAVFWLVGLVLLLWRRKKSTSADLADAGRTQTLADRLRPIVEDALAGNLREGELAELERLLLIYWRKRLALDGMNAGRAVAELRQHAEAGRLLRQLESWLHNPDRPQNVDITELLEPYRHLRADEFSQEELPAAPHAARGMFMESQHKP